MMVIISKSTLNKYGEGYPESKEALLNWYLKVKNENRNKIKKRIP
jgi:mRNA-degrading endonuclease HigB of HigAB toxin-antitoxin module